MKIDWDGPLQFEDGQPITLYGTLNREGKCRFGAGGSEFAESWAELHECGIRRIVVGEDQRFRFPFNEEGHPMDVSYGENGLAKCWKKVMNVPPVSEESMAAMAEHDLWGMF